MYILLIGKPPFESNDVKETYRKIKMNAFSFPESIPLSNEAKDLIERILVNDASIRLIIPQIEEHGFFIKNPFPKLLPASTLAIPPSSAFLKKLGRGSDEICLRGRIPAKLQPSRSSSQPNKEEQNLVDKKNEVRANSGDRNEKSESMRKSYISSLYNYIEGGPKIWIKK